MNQYSKICPVCGYDGFEQQPRDYTICPSCLFEFGVNDKDWTPEQLRQDWIENGAQWAWGSQDIPQPVGWSAERQLLNVSCRLDEKIDDSTSVFSNSLELKPSGNIFVSLLVHKATVQSEIIAIKSHYTPNLFAQYVVS